VAVAAGDRLDFITWGGGGWGDPLERDPDDVASDVRRGLVSADAARDAYGVVLARDGTVDATATERLRTERRPGRQLATFDLGPSLETVLEQCAQETGQPRPTPPGGAR
jgi:N-methylhydantoinase B